MWLPTRPVAGEPAFPLRWRWSNPRPHGNNIASMAYLPLLNRAVQVTERGQVYVSDDLVLWTPRQSGVTNALRSAAFFGAGSRLLIVGEAGKILWSDDQETFHSATFSGTAPTGFLHGLAVSSTLAVAVGAGGAVYVSYTGTNWSRVTPFTSRQFNSVAWGAAGFVAVTEDGFIFHSATGTNNWQPRLSAAAHWNRVGYGLGRYTAVGTGGMVVSSTDGINWQAEATGATNELFTAATSVNGSPIGTRLVAGSNEVRALATGMKEWSDELRITNGPPAWTYLSALGRPGFFVVGGRTGMLVEGYTTNGTAPFLWIPTSDTLRPWFFDATYAANLYVAVGDRATVMTSGNGVDWTLELVPPAATNATFLGLGGSDNLLLAVGTGGQIILSTNTPVPAVAGEDLSRTNELGVIWHPVPAFTTNDLQGVAHRDDRFVVCGDNGSLFVSSNGLNWAAVASPTTNFLSGLTAFPGGFVATGERGTILRSPDGLNWTALTPPTTNWIWRVRHVGGRLIAAGQNGVLLTSTDGSTWATAVSGTSYWLHDVTWVDGTWFAFGKFGTFLSSTNAMNWTARDIPTLKSLYAAATDSRQLLAAGVEGIILRAPVVPDLTPVRILSYQRVAVADPPSINNVFLFGGRPDQRFTLDYRASFDTNQWISGPMLEFTDGSGTLFYLDPLPASPPSSEFYRATLVP
ncbi:MAG TPA: hypothetical protein VNO52_15540 [Methylomirabilota bacterium]|nr:hypothetical protein [Methylomirabilota bacterium]